MTNILLTGRPGIGKSTVIQKIVSLLGAERANGFWSGEIRENNSRVGFAIETISGKRGVLAHVSQASGPRVSKYLVNIEDIDRIAIPSMIDARESGKIIIIDEIAKMELFSARFAREVDQCLDTGRVVGSIQDRRIPFLDEVRRRSDVRVIEVTLANRDRLPQQIVQSILGQAL
ncbi:MAG: NTPase [Candidatus Hodarchaeota archaeon]